MTSVAVEALAAEEALLVRQWRLQRFRKRLLRLLIAILAIAGVYAMVVPYAAIEWNGTESLPGKVFLIVKWQRPGLGEMGIFQPPANPYYPKGFAFTKIVMGEPGDVISHHGRDVLLNGKVIGTCLQWDSGHRRRLNMTPDGIIPPGYHFVWTPHPHSYDSRYADIGLISDKQIFGKAYRLL
jgi:conjugal transfer pilin signal peptidase TrbI